MADTIIAPPIPPGTPAEHVLKEPLWRIRLRLMRRSLGRNWRLFAANRIGIIGLTVIVIFALMALSHPILMSTVWTASIYDPVQGYDAPRIDKTVVEVVNDPTTEVDLATARIQSNPFIKVGEVLSIPQQPAPPTFTGQYPHLLGTDPLGRDVLSQLLYSTRSAFFLGLTAALVTVFIATAVGAISAYFGGWIDTVLMRFADLILLVPLLPVLIVVSALFAISLPLLGLLIGLLGGFGGTAILLKSQALQVKVKPFIDAARIAGGGHAHLIFRHIVPNVLPLSFLYMMFTVTDAINLEAILSFLGLLSIPMSWGIMINTASSQGYLLSGTDYWWLLIPAGLAISMLCA
ncbi:MAG TPA: ABC transporter permease subunit, partial [Acidimicrobiia bacterium]|nr:ABC transporter permease subunit [Acidimicrobiia bacterium]